MSNLKPGMSVCITGKSGYIFEKGRIEKIIDDQKYGPAIIVNCRRFYINYDPIFINEI